jgi:hypothetical protein
MAKPFCNQCRAQHRHTVNLNGMEIEVTVHIRVIPKDSYIHVQDLVKDAKYSYSFDNDNDLVICSIVATVDEGEGDDEEEKRASHRARLDLN